MYLIDGEGHGYHQCGVNLRPHHHVVSVLRISLVVTSANGGHRRSISALELKAPLTEGSLRFQHGSPAVASITPSLEEDACIF